MYTFRKEPLRISGREVWLLIPDAPPGKMPIVYYPTGEDFPEQEQALWDAVFAGQCPPFVLAAFASDNWDRDFSPWPAPPAFKKSAPFEGKAGETLAWLRDAFLPEVEARAAGLIDAGRRAMLGYSLAGLFSLWCLHTTGLFRGCASCSGSLWYEGFDEFLQGHHPPEGSRVYLSLGDGESKGRNQRMAAVGEITERAYARFQADSHVKETELQWHPGGHFQDVTNRIAQGLRWLVR